MSAELKRGASGWNFLVYTFVFDTFAQLVKARNAVLRPLINLRKDIPQLAAESRVFVLSLKPVCYNLDNSWDLLGYLCNL